MTLQFNQSPYWDDYDATKNFYKILFKPGYAVQARELTQIQDILQNQTSSFGSFIFKSGSQVIGGQITLDTNVIYANVQPLYQNTTVNLANFANTIITDVATQTIRASVIATIPQLSGSPNPPTLMLKYLTGTTFANGANVTIQGSNNGPFLLLANTNSQGVGSVASLREGIFFLDLSNLQPVANSNADTVSISTNGYFVRVPAQTVILDAYDNTPTYRIGLQISDIIVNNQTDSSLLDPALGATNYQGPGADRYQITATLSTRQLVSQDDTAFINLLVVNNGQIQSIQSQPQLSLINNTLAQRTYDEAGNFTVTPFTIKMSDTANNDLANSNTQQYNAILNAGLAYVQGYRYQTVGKTLLSAPRARSTVNVAAYNIPSYFGNYLLVDTVRGEFNPGALPTLDIHCVAWNNVNTTTTFAYANTLIGTTKINSFEYSSASNTSNALTFVYRTSLFDTFINPISGNTVSSNSSNITFGPLFNSADNAYAGMYISIPNTGDFRSITSYNGANRIATVNYPWSSNPNSTFTLIAEIQNAESLGANGNTNWATANCNVNIGSKGILTPTSSFQYVFLTDTNFATYIFPFPNSVIAPGLSGQAYQYRYKIASNQTLSPGVALNVTLSVTGDPSATYAAAGTANSDLISLNDFIVVQNPGAGGGNTIPMISELGRSISTTSTVATFTTAAGDPTFNNVDIFASVKSNIGQKTKTLITANTNTVQVSGGTVIGSFTVYAAAGQIYCTTPLVSTYLATLGIGQDLYFSDAISCMVIDSGNPYVAVSNAMLQAAANNLPIPGGGINITNNYTFFNGQLDSFYDHMTLTLNPGAPIPKGQVLILVNYYSHSTTGGYYTVDSYPNYSTIPVYNSSSGKTYNLRDCVDFRPTRDNLAVTDVFNNTGPILVPEPNPNLFFNTSFAYYLPRIDKVVLTKDGVFQIIQGVSSLNAQPPKTPTQSMLLYTLSIPAYTFYSANVLPTINNNKRYTMADIGVLDKRIQALEYYTALSQTEQNATTQTLVDANGLVRPKNGILVDNFQTTSIADVLNPDYFAAIDTNQQFMTTPIRINNVPLEFNPGASSNYQQNGKIITLPYTPQTMIDQSVCSRTENINPFNITVWNGSIKLDPESDTWLSTNTAPAVIINVAGSNDAWAAGGNTGYSTVWNNWQTIWTGINYLSQTSSTGPIYAIGGNLSGGGGTEGGNQIVSIPQYFQDTIQSTTYQTVENQTRTGIQTIYSSDVVLSPVGTNVINTSILPYMRSNKIKFVAYGMKPYTLVYPFFDNVSVLPYVLNASIITFTQSVFFQDTYEHTDILYDTDGGTNGGLGANSAVVLWVNGNTVYVRDVAGVIYPGKTFQGNLSGNTGIVQSFQHNSGYTGEIIGQRYQSLPFTAGTTALANATSIVLQGSASNLDNYYTGNTIYIASGDGLGQSSTITAYNGASRIATVNWSVVLTNPTTENFYYSIGNMTTDQNGICAGMFILPSTPTTEFPTGTSVFMLTDTPTGNVSFATTKAQDSYTAQGTLQTTQQTFDSTRVPVVTTQTVSQTQTITGDPTVATQTFTYQLNYLDPVSQLFLVDNTLHPDGVHITSIRMCFATADVSLPVTLQIRPTVNGYPDAGLIIPLSEVTLNPSQINLSGSPSLDDPTQFTEFFFDAPIFLFPGQQYAIVLISNSNQYTFYTAVVGDKQLGSNRLISQPPYLGSFFKSQNSTTWTAYQGENMMFRVMQAKFDNNDGQPLFAQAGFVGPMQLVANTPASIANSAFNRMSNTEFYIDTLYLTNQDLLIRDTNLSYLYRGTSNTTRILDSTYTNIIPNSNYNLPIHEVITPKGNAFSLLVRGTSVNQDVSPVIDLERYSLIGINNLINPGSISNNNISITNPGQGYNISNTNIITVSGGGGSGAQLSIGSLDANGNITSIIVNTGGGGTGYSSTPNGSITTSGYTPTINATFTIAGETNASGGNFVARYITRMVTLAPGMDAGDINVIFNAYKPTGTQIYVYYKILNATDTTTFANRPYTQMALDGTDSFSQSASQFNEYSYVGAVSATGAPIRQISYNGYNTFKYFAIKIVLSSANPAIVPIIQNLQIIAMPGTT